MRTDTVCLDLKSVFSMCPTYNRMTDCQAAAVIDSLPGVTETSARQRFLLEVRPNCPDTIPQVLESEKHRDELTLCRYFGLFTQTLTDGCIHPGNVQQLCPQKASCACTQSTCKNARESAKGKGGPCRNEGRTKKNNHCGLQGAQAAGRPS